MKVSLLARPDHSVALYEALCALGIDVDYSTFYAFRRDGLLHKLLPSRKTVPGSADIALAFTLLGYTIGKLGARAGLNWRRVEKRLGDVLLSARDLEQADIVHYWPFYFDRLVNHARPHLQGHTIAELYEAESSFVNTLYRDAYTSLGVPFEAPINEMIDQNAIFAHEHDFLAASEFTKRSYLRRFPDANIHVVSFGLMGRNVELRKRKPAPRTRWVFVGQACIEKGVHTLLDAMAMCTDISVDVIGPIRQGQNAYFTSRLEGRRNVRYLGPMRNGDVLARLPSYDAFVLPSLSDNYPIAAVEASSAGLPVVVSENCGYADEVLRYGIGQVCAVGDPRGLAEAITRVAFETRDDELEAGLRRFAADEARSSYGRRVLELYRKLLAAST